MEKTGNFPLMSRLQFYGMDGKHATAAGIIYELDEDIDFTIMESAYLRAMQRFPYFNVKLRWENNALYRAWADEPPALQKDAEDYLINERENNGYLYRVSANGRKLSMQMFHGLSDGSGMNHAAGLILSLYYQALGEEVSGIDDRFSPGEEADPSEYMDPLELELFDGVAAVPSEKTPFYTIPEKNDRVLELYWFSCDGEDLIEYVKSHDGTPNAVTAIMLARAIAGLRPESAGKTIRIGITINGKPILGLDKNSTPFMHVSDFDFNEKRLSMGNALLHTCVRGKLFADSFDDILIPKFARLKNIGRMYRMMPSLKAKKLLSNMVIDTPAATCSVSYAGRCSMGSIEKHIKSVCSFARSSSPLMEINYANGRFFFCLSTRFDGKQYMEAFAKELNRLGVLCSDIRTLRFREGAGKASGRVKFGLNRATFELIRARRRMKRE